MRGAHCQAGVAPQQPLPSGTTPPYPQLGLALLTNGLCDGTDEDHRGHPDQRSDPRRHGHGLGVLASVFAFRFGQQDAEAGRRRPGRSEVVRVIGGMGQVWGRSRTRREDRSTDRDLAESMQRVRFRTVGLEQLPSRSVESRDGNVRKALPETGRVFRAGRVCILGDRFLTRSERPLKSQPERTMEPAEAMLVCSTTLFLLGQGVAADPEPSGNRHPGRLMEVVWCQPEAPA